VNVITTTREDILDVTFVSTNVMVMVSVNQVNVLTDDSASELLDVFKSTKTEIT
jgi:hypothetical protein